MNGFATTLAIIGLVAGLVFVAALFVTAALHGRTGKSSKRRRRR